ncbi:hypothetical protein [Burkholderia stabilis]|uniref:hypothetical protein n=1 Tax=Burkholderia stabilis TaxID=95485 RepID=UPI0015904286|nr:hypothetical protein [Burkholderia stabilis]
MGNIVDRHTGRNDTQSGLCAAADTLSVVLDTNGVPFSPASCNHAFEYDATGNLVTDTAIDPITGIKRVQSYTYEKSILIGNSAWERI